METLQFSASNTTAAMSHVDMIHSLAKEPISDVEEDAYVRAFLMGHRNTNPYCKHFAYRHNAWKSKKIISSLHNGGARLMDFVKDAGVMLRDYKVVQFANIIRSQKPQVVYEFGAGGTTAFIAELLHENYQKYGVKGELHSFEQSEDYFRSMTDALPEELKQYVSIHQCEVEYKRVDGFRLLSYKKPDLGHSTVDLIYIDGPDHIYDGIHYKDHPFFNSDIIDLANNGVKIQYAVNDGRWFNMPAYEHFIPSYKCTQLPRFKSFIIKPK